MAELKTADAETPGSPPNYEFDVIALSGSNTMAPDSGAKYLGASGYKLTFLGVASLVRGEWNSLGAATNLYNRSMMRWPSSGLSLSDNDVLWWQFFYAGGPKVFCMELHMTYHSASSTFGALVRINTSGGWVTIYSNAAGSDFSLDTWYCIEAHYYVHASAGGGQFWIDEASKGSDFARDTSGNTMGYAYHGIASSPNNPGNGTVLHLDDMVIADTGPIGMPGAEGGPSIGAIERGGLIEPSWFDLVRYGRKKR